MRVIKERYHRPTQADTGVRVRPAFDDFHRLRMEGEFEYPEHRHANYELILVERGPYRCRLNGMELALARGQILVVKPGDMHLDHLRHGQVHYVVHFRLPAVELFRAEAPPRMQICRTNHVRDVLFMRELRRESAQGAAHAAAVQDSLLEALFWRTVRDLPVEGLSAEIRRLPQNEAMRERIGTAVERHLHGNPTVREIARELEISPRHLTGLCRRLFGDSPARLLLRLKLRHAEEMLCYGDRRVKEVSEALGFANPFHFSRVFRRHVGRSPSQR
jgi:AraC family transcriptional activator of pobA